MNVTQWYNNSYKKDTFEAQRKWPNEELCRFMGRNYFPIPYSERGKINILELGCGSGCNISMLLQEGYGTWGIDISSEAIELCKQLIPLKGISNGNRAHLFVGDMRDLEFEDNSFDAVLDVYSSFCLNKSQWMECLKEVYRVLKPGGKFFCYTPSKNSDAFINFAPSVKIDESTLDGIHRENSPYYGNFYQFRFVDEREICADTSELFEIDYIERVGRTYRNGEEYFEFLVFELIKK